MTRLRIFLFVVICFAAKAQNATGRPKACVGTPGNTTAAQFQQCYTAAGAGYVCNNAAGCTVAADWVAQGAGSPSAFVDFQKQGSVLTGTGSDVVVFTTTIPSIGAGKCLHYRFGVANGGSGANSYKMCYGSTCYTFNGSSVGGNSPFNIHGEFCNEPGVQNVQDLELPYVNYAGTQWFTPNSGLPILGVFAIDSTSPQAFALKVNGSAGTATYQGLWWSITQDR
jgi:hypothetical protein